MNRQLVSCICGFLGVILAVCPTILFAQARETLPDTVVPSHYDLAIRPDLEALTFTGTNAATIDVRTPTRDIVLNADGLTFDRVTLETGAVGTTSYDARLGRATIRFAAPVRTGRHRLTIDYHGAIGRETVGAFAMDYDTPAGPRRTLATNLEPAFARKVFPGWDEPGLKATYTVTVDAPSDRMAISNMPIARTKPLSPTMTRVTFAESPRMSSYLFFLGIGDWERISRKVDGIDLGVVVRRGDTSRGRYALDEAAALLGWYNRYFGVRYPLPKLDLIAAPGQIASVAMENWGAILYSQQSLLIDPTTGTASERQGVFSVVAHEMAHQWFGDLVTMTWWDDLWLNEGFARWMQVRVADALHPDWKTGLGAQSIFEKGKAQDALPSTHPIVQRIRTVNEAGDAFDGITYDKGAAVITMLAATIGDAAFRDGVRAYMRAHAYANTVDADFWTTMQRVSGKPILGIERDFTTQPGLPLIRVIKAANGVDLTTDRFTLEGADKKQTVERWRIPLTIAAGGKAAPLLLDGRASIPASGPVLVNAGQTAYARVLYDPATYAALMPQVATLAPVDQIGLAQDALALAEAGYVPGGNLLDIVSRIPSSALTVVWARVADILTTVDQAYANRSARMAYRRYAVSLLRPALATLGSTPRAGEAADVPVARERLVRALGTFGDAEVLADARATMASGAATPGDRRTAQTVIAAKADAATFDALLAQARASDDPLQKLRLYRMLAGVEDETLARRMVPIVLGGEVPAGTNAPLAVALARAHPRLVWNEVVPHLADPKVAMTPGDRRRVAATVIGLLDDPAMIPDVRAYVEREVPVDARGLFDGAIAAIGVNARVATRMLPELDRWIVDHAQ